jgi:hypothetical protein
MNFAVVSELTSTHGFTAIIVLALLAARHI